MPAGTWTDGSTHGNWTLTYNGYGTAGIESAESLALMGAPKASTTASETHAILFNSVPRFSDMDVTVRMRTVSMLRTPTPNPWEVAWFLWHYTDDTHFYSLVLKPNGWELGKEDPAYPGAQRYLATGSAKTFPVGPWYTVRVVQVGNAMSVYVDGVLLVSYADNERPYTSGSLGLYSEDSHVHFDDIVVKSP